MLRSRFPTFLCVALSLLLAGGAAPSAPEARAHVAPFTVKTLEGKGLKLASLKGKVVVVAFWASWCSPCKLELAALEELRARLARDDLEIIALTTDGPETLSTVRSMVRSKKWQFKVAADTDGQVSATLNPRGSMPHSIFIDRQGRLAHAHTGFRAGDEALYGSVLEKLLAEPRP